MYVFVRRDLSIAQQIIQSAHATFEVGLVEDISKSPNFVLIGVDNLQHLRNVERVLQAGGIGYNIFFEPDVDQHTAIATAPIKGNKRKFFKHFELYRG